jgi:hypothetical protein
MLEFQTGSSKRYPAKSWLKKSAAPKTMTHEFGAEHPVRQHL